MKFRNYCLVVMGDTKNVMGEIVKVAESKPNVLDARGILISTFSSIAEPKELTDYFKLNRRNFLIFDLDSENSGFNMVKDDINEGLFGFLKDMTANSLEQRTKDLIQEISSTTVSKTYKAEGKKDNTKTLILLKERLKAAEDVEDYELAIQLRDEIKKMIESAKKTS